MIRPCYRNDQFVGFCLHVFNQHLQDFEPAGCVYRRYACAVLAMRVLEPYA